MDNMSNIADQWLLVDDLEHEGMEELLMDYEKQLMRSIDDTTSTEYQHHHQVTSSGGISGGGNGGCPNVMSAGADPPAAIGESSRINPMQVISFGSSDKDQMISSEEYYSFGQDQDLDEWVASTYYSSSNNNNQSNKRSGYYAQEHVLHERKRRQKLTHNILQLASLLPALNKAKMDKATAIEEATNYIKQLQEENKLLNEQIKEKTGEYSSMEDKEWSSDETFDNIVVSSTEDPAIVEIDIKVSNRVMLITIHAKKDYNLLSKILSEVEKFQLRPMNNFMTLFGDYGMHVTISAQMEAECSMTVEHLVQHLRLAIQKL